MRRSYRVTRAGAKAYRAWVAERLADDPQRTQLLARITSTAGLGLDGMLDVIDRYEQACGQELDALFADFPEIEDGPVSAEQLARFLIADQRRRELGARREWASHARSLIEARMPGGRGGRSRGAGS